MTPTRWVVGIAVLVAPGFLAAGIASAASVTITDDDISGVQIQYSGFDVRAPDLSGLGTESASLDDGRWTTLYHISHNFAAFFVEPGTTTLSDFLIGTWIYRGTDFLQLHLHFESDVDGVLGNIPQYWPDWQANGWYIEETGSLQNISGLLRDPGDGRLLSLQFTNLSMFVSSDLDPIPEPSTLVLLGMGLVGFAAFGRKRLQG